MILGAILETETINNLVDIFTIIVLGALGKGGKKVVNNATDHLSERMDTFEKRLDAQDRRLLKIDQTTLEIDRVVTEE